MDRRRIDKMLENTINSHIDIIKSLKQKEITRSIESAGLLIKKTLDQGNKLLLCGNGGSAADCQHIAAEMVVRFRKDRKALSAIALTTDTSILTAHSNDYEFNTVFSRQISAIGKEGDCLIAISTSGNSANVIEAARYAKHQGIFVIGLTGCNGGKLVKNTDIIVIVPCDSTERIQEAHILIAHWWCELIENMGV